MVFLWTVLPLLLLHWWMWRRSRKVLYFQLALDLCLAVVIGPALIRGGDLNPVRCLQRNAPFTDYRWSESTEYQPTQSDLVLQFHPWWEAARKQLLEGRLPLIAEDIGGGLPLLANGQTGLWAPVMLPVWVLGAERGTTVMAWWKIECAGLGAFLFLSSWRLRWRAAALGALAYAGSAYQVAWLLVPLAWVTATLPWLWWLVVSALKRRAGRHLVVITGVACGWLLGCGLHPETAVIVIGSAFMAGLILHPRRWTRVVAAAALMVVIALVMAWPTVGYINASARTEVTRNQHPNREGPPLLWKGLAARQLLVPAINGHPGRGDWRAPFQHAPAATGIGGLALALLVAGRVRRRHRRLLWAALGCLGVAAVLFYRVPPIDWLLVRLPPFDRMTLPRFAALVPWGLAVWAALAADGVLRGLRRWWGWVAAPVGLTILVVLSRPLQLESADHALVLLTVAAAAAAPVLISRPGLAVFAVAAELALYAIGINPVAASTDRLPRTEVVERLRTFQAAEGGRVMGLGGVLPANLAGRYDIPDLRAYDPLRPAPLARLFSTLGAADPVLGGAVRRAPAGLCGWWSVRFLIAREDASVPGWDRIWYDRSGSLWSNPRWLPEMGVVGRTVVGGWGLIAADAVNFENTAVLPEGEDAVVGAESVGLEVLEIRGDRARAKVECEGPCLVTLARPWAPGWKAAVDGATAEIVRANLAGLGVVVPAGMHDVEFTYHPWGW